VLPSLGEHETYLVMVVFMDAFLKTINTQYTGAIISTVPKTEKNILKFNNNKQQKISFLPRVRNNFVSLL